VYYISWPILCCLSTSLEISKRATSYTRILLKARTRRRCGCVVDTLTDSHSVYINGGAHLLRLSHKSFTESAGQCTDRARTNLLICTWSTRPYARRDSLKLYTKDIVSKSTRFNECVEYGWLTITVSDWRNWGNEHDRKRQANFICILTLIYILTVSHTGSPSWRTVYHLHGLNGWDGWQWWVGFGFKVGCGFQLTERHIDTIWLLQGREREVVDRKLVKLDTGFVAVQPSLTEYRIHCRISKHYSEAE
jgi:hypothetical protein